MPGRHVVRKAQLLSKDEAKKRFASGLLRAVSTHGKGTVADAMGRTTRVVEKALALDTLPELDSALNALRIDHTIFDEALAHYGLKLAPDDATQATDMDVVALLGLVVARIGDAHAPASPGGAERVHTETLAIADVARPLVQLLSGIIAEADRIRGVGR